MSHLHSLAFPLAWQTRKPEVFSSKPHDPSQKCPRAISAQERTPQRIASAPAIPAALLRCSNSNCSLSTFSVLFFSLQSLQSVLFLLIPDLVDLYNRSTPSIMAFRGKILLSGYNIDLSI
ncbi:uncharacterized protein LY89DRAFT_118863 [Mollisia scopiformis]|uniref:Uncharacterized protein n=1 Tax=Mollisia scopiformis TaxID=149040 RepID=A0A194X3C6_MOLSC|nr:uncharacterized protein LY89DRAFT_118863 [Mollisia scopiformis]KUJ14671.1 hypothetical protein LY89DRAFT_118863 [Mollisia scopiformis]